MATKPMSEAERRWRAKFVEQPPPGMLPSGKLNIVKPAPEDEDEKDKAAAKNPRDAFVDRVGAVVKHVENKR